MATLPKTYRSHSCTESSSVDSAAARMADHRVTGRSDAVLEFGVGEVDGGDSEGSSKYQPVAARPRLPAACSSAVPFP
jgi:hypothetical protein